MPNSLASPIRQLGELAHVVTKGTTPTTLGHDYAASGIPFIRANNLVGAYVDTAKDVLFIDAMADDLLKRSRIFPGDVLLSIAGTIGRASRVPGNAPMLNCNQAVCIIRCTSEIDGDFLRYWLESESAKSQIASSKVTGVISNLSLTQVKSLKVPLPPLSEQRRIVAILDKADALRAKRREAIAKLDQLLQSVFLEMFGDPVTNPKGWPMLPFGTVTDSRLGKMLDKRTSQGEHMKPYLANLNVQWGRFELNSLRSMHFSLKDQQEFSLRSGDLLMCEGGQPGRCAIWQEQITDCYYQKALHRIRCHQEKCVPEYIQWLFWFLSQANAFSSAVTTATIAHLPGIKLKKMLVPLPPIEEQRAFASLIQSIEKSAVLHRSAEEKLNHMFSSLQKNVFEGSRGA